MFQGILAVIPELGMKLRSHDAVIGRITASVGMSLLSWGENLTLVVEKIDEAKTLVMIESSLKLGGNIVGAHRHHNNFEKIIVALSKQLQQPLQDEIPSQSSGPLTFIYCPTCNAINREATACTRCGAQLGV